MTAKHTLGPWILEDLFIYKLHEQTGASGRPFITNVFSVAVQGNGTHGAQRDELEANARLIAAAPELLETCKAARQLWNDFLTKKESFADYASRAQQVQSMLADAIAKAEGRT